MAAVAENRAYLKGRDDAAEGLGEAARWLDKAEAIAPDSIDVWIGRALWLDCKKDHAAARALAERAAARAPTNVAAATILADDDLDEQKLDETLARLRTIVETARKKRHIDFAYGRLVDVFGWLGKPDAVDEVHRILVARKPDSPWVRGNYGAFLVARHDYAHAIDRLEEARVRHDYGVLHGAFADTYAGLGVEALWDAHDAATAARWFQRALDEDPSHAIAKDGLKTVQAFR
jgi:Tfp pilus assembly protein PilF